MALEHTILADNLPLAHEAVTAYKFLGAQLCRGSIHDGVKVRAGNASTGAERYQAKTAYALLIRY